MSVGQKIKNIRKSRNISQERLGKLSGLTQQTISHIENGVNSPTEETIRLIAKGLECSVSDLMESGDNTCEADEVMKLREKLRTRPDMRILFSVADKATESEVMQAVKIIEALRK